MEQLTPSILEKAITGIRLSEERTNSLPMIDCGNTKYPLKIDKTTNMPYVSCYNDDKPIETVIESFLSRLFLVFNIEQEKLKAYTDFVVISGITSKQLVDSINNICLTWDHTMYGKPKPADIVQYDKKKAFAIFSYDELHFIIDKLMEAYHPEIGKTSYDYTNFVVDMSNGWFSVVKDGRGLPLKDKKKEMNNCFYSIRPEYYEKVMSVLR